jgi:hypothetical protein
MEKTTRSFPWVCPQCLTPTVVPVVQSYCSAVNHNGAVLYINYSEIAIPQCGVCEMKLFDNRFDDEISKSIMEMTNG